MTKTTYIFSTEGNKPHRGYETTESPSLLEEDLIYGSAHAAKKRDQVYMHDSINYLMTTVIQ